jgi:hypothetical protein
MATMTTTRSYWVDWICVFDKQPSVTELKSNQAKIIQYLKNYLNGLTKKSPKGSTGASNTVFNEVLLEWDAKKLIWGPLKSKIKNQGNIMLGSKNNWIKMLRWEWDQISSKPLVFNFKAYFEGNGIRYTDVRGTMTPPPPPPPSGN